MHKLKLLALINILMLSGCIAVPNLQENQTIKTPKTIDNTSINTNSDKNNQQNIKPLSVISNKWWQNFNDNQLNDLMDNVLQNNDDIKIALLNIEKLKIGLDLAKTAQIPSINADGFVQRQKFSEHGLTPPAYAGDNINFSQIAVSSSYDFDLLHKFDFLISEQDYKLKALQLQKDALVLILSTQVLKHYAYWQYINQQQDYLGKLIQLSQQKIEFQLKKIALGKATEQSIITDKNNLEAIKIQFEQNKKNLKQAENSMQILLGNFDIKSLTKNSKILNFSLPDINAVNSDAIVKRPDIAYYIEIIEAQKNHLQALKADFYPSVSIDGKIGLQKSGLNLLNINNWFANLGPSIHLPIFDAGKIRGTYKIAGVEQNIFIQQYNQAVLKSFYDINTQLYNYKNAKQVLNQQNYIFANQNKNFGFNQKQFELGNISKLEWNIFQQQNLQENMQNLINQFSYFNSQIDLINALGGTVK